ncbi:MAG: hypothetical protein ACUVXD_03905 [Thermodesulfobacteriota bacterium]
MKPEPRPGQVGSLSHGARPLAATEELARQVISEASSALLAWLDEGWIETQGEWNIHKARIALNRDWYSPCWTVTFTVEDPPWFGDTIQVEVEELAGGSFWVVLDGPGFVEENIVCQHEGSRLPEGHWVTGNRRKRIYP